MKREFYLIIILSLLGFTSLLSASTDDKIITAKKICKDLGFKLDSDKFENCFIQMMEVVDLQADKTLIEASGNTEINLKKLRATLSCRGCNLTEADLEGENLIGADLSNAILIDVNFKGSNLAKVDFSGAILIRGDLSGADVRKVNFTEADLTDANLTNAALKNVIFSDTILCNTKTPWGIDNSRCAK
jgi:uncharacterized protein YjbI with pentapeptide repeats